MRIEVFVTQINPLRAGLKSISSLFNRFPLEIAYYTQPEFRAIVNKLIKERNFELCFAFFMRTAEYIKNLKCKKILMAEDCRMLYQKRSYEESSNLVQKTVRWYEWKKLKHYEPEIVNHFDAVTLVSNEDIEAMKKQNPRANYRLLTNGVDITTYLPPKEARREGILFAGKLDVWANVLMLQTIITKILPEIRREIPNIEFNVVGANPTASIISLCKSDKNINLISNVPEMLPYLQNAALFLHPHAGGSGIQNKLLEAMACGCPVVTTPSGMQGINGRDGIEVLIGKTPEELAFNAVRVLKDKYLFEKITANARALIERKHSWYVIYDALDNIIFELFDNADKGKTS